MLLIFSEIEKNILLEDKLSVDFSIPNDSSVSAAIVDLFSVTQAVSVRKQMPGSCQFINLLNVSVKDKNCWWEENIVLFCFSTFFILFCFNWSTWLCNDIFV